MMGWETEHMPSLHPASQSMQSDKDENYGVNLVQLLVFPKISVWLESHLAFQRRVGFATSLLSLIKSKILVVDVDLKYLGDSVN